MAKSKELIPDFMMDSPDDSFMFLMPTGFKPDLVEDIGNSSLNVIVKNLTKHKVFKTKITPELFFTKFKLHQAYKNGKLDKKYKHRNMYRDKFIEEAQYPINSNVMDRKLYDAKLDSILPERFIGQLLGWNRDFIKEASEITCYFIPGNINMIVPHYAIASYYYFRSSLFREAVLRCNLESLYYQCECDRNASIVVPKYVNEEMTPFIHRFICQPDASEAFESMGKYLLSYMDYYKNDKTKKFEEHLPLKAKFPIKSQFKIWTRHTYFYDEETHKPFIYIHEITNDNSDVGFDKLTTYYPGSNVIFDEKGSLDNIPVIPLKDPMNTTSRLNSKPGSKGYSHHSVTFKHNKACKSLENVERLTAKLTTAELLQKLYIVNETSSDETVDQSATASLEGQDELVRKCRISTNGIGLAKKIKEHTSNFDEFRQYMSYLQTQNETIKNLVVYEAQKIETVINEEDEKPNPKCMIHGREREYITATFKYEDIYVRLLELENTASTSTWVISSKQPFGNDVFDQFLQHYVNENQSIDKIKQSYGADKPIRFRTKNHEKSKILVKEDLIRWAAGVLGKV